MTNLRRRARELLTPDDMNGVGPPEGSHNNPNGRGGKQVTNVLAQNISLNNAKKKYGDTTYILARLKRDNPAIEFYEFDKPFGLGNPVRLRDRIGKLRKWGRPSKDIKGSNTNLLRGDNKSYILARLKRDNPQILSDYENSIYKSARQAGIAAGFVKDVKRIQVEIEPNK